MKLLALLVLLLLGGCASDNVKPYFEVGGGYIIDGMTDYWLQTTNKDQCSKQPQAHFEAGWETRSYWKVGLHHQSWYFCGEPFNHDPEIDSNYISVSKKFGGIR